MNHGTTMEENLEQRIVDTWHPSIGGRALTLEEAREVIERAELDLYPNAFYVEQVRAGRIALGVGESGDIFFTHPPMDR